MQIQYTRGEHLMEDGQVSAYVFLKVEGAVLQQGFKHSHQVYQYGQVAVDAVDLHALRYKCTEPRQHLV